MIAAMWLPCIWVRTNVSKAGLDARSAYEVAGISIAPTRWRGLLSRPDSRRHPQPRRRCAGRLVAPTCRCSHGRGPGSGRVEVVYLQLVSDGWACWPMASSERGSTTSTKRCRSNVWPSMAPLRAGRGCGQSTRGRRGRECLPSGLSACSRSMCRLWAPVGVARTPRRHRRDPCAPGGFSVAAALDAQFHQVRAGTE